MAGADPINVTTETHPDGAVLRIAGEVDMATADRLRAHLEAAIAAYENVSLDLTGVTFIDSYGLRVLVSAHGVVPAGLGTFAIVDASPQVRRTFTVTGLDLAYRWPSQRHPA